MRNLAVRTLVFGDEIYRGASGSVISFCVEGERSPEGIATKEPGKARALPDARRAVSGNQSGPEIRIIHHALNGADAGPVICLLKDRIRKFELHSFIQIRAVIFCGFVDRGCGRIKQMLVGCGRILEAIDGCGDRDCPSILAFLDNAEAHRILVRERVVGLIGDVRVARAGRSH